jgi:UDP-glucose 4-epimerase
MRCFSFIQDDVQVLEKLAFQEDGVLGEVINIGPDEEFVTINELAQTIAELTDFKLDPIYMPDRPQEVKLANCSADKARRLLGYKTKYTLRQGLIEMIDWIKKRGTKPFRYHLDLEIINEYTTKSWKEKLF